MFISHRKKQGRRKERATPSLAGRRSFEQRITSS
jgi:hypothetical protein